MISNEDWENLIASVMDVQEMFPTDAVFIGGIAVFFHALDKEKKLAEFSHDGDLMISRLQYPDMRELYECIPNNRLNKAQFIKDGFEFDVYVEGRNSLIVPYPDVVSHSICKGVRVAALEHLLALKLEAYKDRKDSSKGLKDGRDIQRILFLMDNPKSELFSLFADDTNIKLLKDVAKNVSLSREVCKGDYQWASHFQKHLQTNLKFLLDGDCAPSSPRP